MKRFCTALLAALVLCAACAPAAAANALSWTLDGGTLVLSGRGAWTDYSDAADAPWYAARAQITCIVVEQGITGIGSNSFVGCAALTQVYLPNGLASIGKNAFWGCGALESIALPASLEYIGSCAFFRCGLTAVRIPDGVSVLEQGVFGQCEHLATVTLHDNIRSICKDAFSRCYQLRTLTLPQGLEQLGEHAFFACIGLERLDFSAQLRKINSAAFYGCSALGTLSFGGGAPTLAADAFLGLTASVEYPRAESSWSSIANDGYGGRVTWRSVCAHRFTDYVSDGNATVDADGTKTARCDYGCGATDTVPDEGSRLHAVLTSDIYTVGEGQIVGIPVQTSAADFLSCFHQENVRLVRAGTSVSGDAPVGTGMVVQQLVGGSVIGEWVVAVVGDVNGDGARSITDLLGIKAHLLKKSALAGIYAQAADLSGDGDISITDFIQLKAILLAR